MKHASTLLGVALAATALMPTALQAQTRLFGAQATAGPLTTGGEYRRSASVTSSSVNVLGDASGSLSGGDLHAYAWSSNNPTLPNGCRPDMLWCNWGISASITVWDTITLKAGPAYRPGTPVDYVFSADGSKTPGRWWSANRATASYYIGLSPKGWDNPTMMALGNNDQIGGSFEMPANGANLVLYFKAGLNVFAEGGAVTDYSNTLRFNWDLPEGVTYTSASGVFMTSAVPESSSWALLTSGLSVMGGLARRRRRQGAR